MNGIYGNPAFTLDGVLLAVEASIEATKAQRRYEYLRTLNPRQFQELWTKNLNGEGSFDDLVDAALAGGRAGTKAEIDDCCMSEENDRELLERAAKAAGYELQPLTVGGSDRLYLPGEMHFWDPLTDDGDALRLAVKLRISIQQEADAWKLQASTNCGLYGEGAPEWAEEVHGNDSNAATRRAIVRAAAALSKGA